MDTPRWLFDERAHAGHEHLDPTYVATYDKKAGVEPESDVDLLRGLGLDKTCTLVDLGAGTGVFALTAAPSCRRVVAVDVSPAMNAILREKAEQLGRRNIECIEAGFLTYEHHGEPAGFVHSRNALHHLPDFWKAVALGRIAGILKPGGVLRLRDLVFSFNPGEVESHIEAWLAGAPDRPSEGWTRPELEAHLREEYSTFSWLLEPMIERAGFQIRDAAYTSSGMYAAYICVKREKARFSS